MQNKKGALDAPLIISGKPYPLDTARYCSQSPVPQLDRQTPTGRLPQS